MDEIKQISTSALAKKYNIPINEMFSQLIQLGFMEQKGEIRSLTDLGVKAGGKFVTSKKFGKYITWPENFTVYINQESKISATGIGKKFELSANKINHILSELGWIKKALKGWTITTQGKKLGGVQHENKKTGIPFIKWPSSLIKSKILINAIQDYKGTKVSNTIEIEDEFRNKFIAKHRATDGHFVRSKSEMLIDNWLYVAGIVHAYERKLPIEENVYSDFYIPAGNVYIEFWGYENNKKYLKRKKEKQKIYKKYGFNLIELTDKEVLNLDDILPRMLLKHNIQAY